MNEDRTHRANAVVHFDISGPHEEDMHRFYRDLLGWQVSPQGPGYALVETPGGLGGAISNAPAASVCIGVAVPDIEQAVARASELGSDVVMPPTDNGWVTKAEVKDPAGNLLTLIQT